VKKILIVSTILLITFNLFNIPKASANPGVRVVGSLAEKAMISISEKAGAKYATEKASEKAIKRWNMELYEDLAKQTNYNNINEPLQKAKIIPFPETDKRYGKFGKILIGGALFLTGADIAIDVYNDIKNAENEQKMLELMETTELPDGSYQNIYGFTMVPGSEPTTDYFTVYQNGEFYDEQSRSSYYFSSPTYLKIEKSSTSDRRRIVGYARWLYGDNDFSVVMATEYFDSYRWDEFISSGNPLTTSEVPKGWTAPGDFPDYIREYSDPNTSPERKEEIIKEVEHAFPEGVPIVVPIKETAPGEPLEIDDSPYKETPYEWNDPLPDNLPDPGTNPDPGTDPGTEPNPDPGTEPNPNPDPGTDPTNPTNPGDGDGGDPTNPGNPSNPGTPKNPIPIALALALLDLLVAIIMYIGRMLEFILTIPLIPEIPINNTAFQWFKSAKIMGVHVYPIVMSMGTIGLSFLVFKAIRKVMP